MIIYGTKKTLERFNLQTPEELSQPQRDMAKILIEREQNEPLLQWGAKLFYFDRRKCLQLVNFASKLTIFLPGLKNEDMPNLANYIAAALLDLYKDDAKATALIEKLFQKSPFFCFAPLTDRRIIATLNHTQISFLCDGDILYDYISDGILHSKDVNRRFNFDWIVTETINKKTEYLYPGKRFRELLMEHFKNSNTNRFVHQRSHFTN